MICTLLTAIGLLGTASVAPSGPSAVAELSLPWVFSDHMVLQRGVPIRIAGEAIPHTQITVEFGGESEATGADAAGRWRLELAARPATFDGEELVVRSGDRELRFADVVIGDVWLCAGQSNMDFPVARAIGGSKASREATRIRLCKRTGSPTAAARPFTTDELAKISGGRFYDGEWQLASPSSVSKFSAVGFSFGRYLEDALDVPIGLIDVSVGGSTTEGWISRERLTRDESIAPLVRDYLASPLTHSFIKERVALNLQTWAAGDQQSARPVHFFEPGFLFEHAIAGLTQTPIRGVCWYQGESNAHLPRTADKLFRTLLEDWRAAWSIADLPFYYVQLPGMNRPTWPRFREVQAGWLDDPDVGMAVTIDLGHPTDVHPRDKAPIGERLARLALARTYGLDVADSGPTAPVVKRTGDRLIVSFSGAQVLRWAPGRDASGFEIAGADRRYYPATAVIDGQRVVLTSPEVGRPSAARYCWAPDPEWSLVGRAGLPAAPFRVQSWAPTRVACIGDSITAGHGLDDPARHSYPAQLQAMLGDGFDVRNFGHSGTCVVQSTMRGAWHRAF